MNIVAFDKPFQLYMCIKVVSLNAQNVANLGGRIRGDAVRVQAKEDLNNIGGNITAGSELMATAGRDINIETTTRSASNAVGANTFSRTGIDRVAGLYVSNPGGTLVASAGRDANIIAGVISNAGQGSSTVIAAGRDINLGTVSTARSDAIAWDAQNWLKASSSSEVGSQVQVGGDLRLQAGNDLNARAATLEAGQALIATAGNNVNLTAGQSRQSVDEAHQSKSKGFLSSKTITTRDQLERSDSIGSSLGGNSVTVVAGQDIKVQGSTVVSDSGTTLLAGNNLIIEAAQNTYASSSLRDEKKSGIFSGGGLSITAGKQQQSTDNSMHSCYGSGGNNCTQVEAPLRNGPQGTPEGNAKLIRYEGGKIVDSNSLGRDLQGRTK